MKETEEGAIVIKFSIVWFFLVIIIIGLLISFFKSNIFATNDNKEKKMRL